MPLRACPEIQLVPKLLNDAVHLLRILNDARCDGNEQLGAPDGVCLVLE